MTKNGGVTYELRGFTKHGVRFNPELAGNQGVADCPFCGKEGKFYANSENRLWDCKRCGRKGNFGAFLQETFVCRYATGISDKVFRKWADYRRLPIESFSRISQYLGSDENRLVFPIYDHNRKIIDLRIAEQNKKVFSTPTVKTGLFGLFQLLLNSDKSDPVYICEGEWDAIAMNWLLWKAGRKGAVVGTPGANVFKTEWLPAFSGRKVVVLYDNDQAGIYGEIRVAEMLTGTATSIQHLHWPADLQHG